MNDPLDSERDFISYLTQGYLVGCARAVILTTELDAHVGWASGNAPIPAERHSILARKVWDITSSPHTLQEWQAAQMEQKAERLTCFLTGRADPHPIPGFLHPWIRYALKMREPPLHVLDGLLKRACGMVQAVHKVFFENPDLSSAKSMRRQIAGLVTRMSWAPTPVDVDETDRWISLAEFAETHPVWAGKVVALPGLLIGRREVGEICHSVCCS